MVDLTAKRAISNLMVVLSFSLRREMTHADAAHAHHGSLRKVGKTDIHFSVILVCGVKHRSFWITAVTGRS